MLTQDILLLILELVSKDTKSLLRLMAVNKRMNGLLKELAKLDPKKVSRVVFLKETQRLGLRQKAIRLQLKRDMAGHRQHGTQFAKLKMQAMGLEVSGQKEVLAAQGMLVQALVFTRKLIGRFAKAARAEVRDSIRIYADIGKYLEHYRNHLDADDAALLDAVDKAYEANSTKSKLAKQYADFDKCILKPYNDCVDLCLNLQLKGVPKKLATW